MPKVREENFEGLEKNKKYFISSDSESQESHSSSDSNNSPDSDHNQKKIITVRQCQPKKILDCKIKNMQYSLTKILTGENKTKYIDNLSRDNLLTIKLIIKNIESLKNVDYLRQESVDSFKKCKNELKDLYLASKKCDIKNALLKIGNLDNFQSLKNILLGNREISKLNKKLYRQRSTLKRNQKYAKIRKY